jgi:hypothetical protein
MGKALIGASLAAFLSCSSCGMNRPVVSEQSLAKIMKDNVDSKAFFAEVRKRRANERAAFKRVLGMPAEKAGPPRRYPCEKGLILPGGQPSHAYVLLQAHRDPIDQELSLESMRSQLLIIRVLRHLAEKEGVRMIFMEGELLGQSKEKNAGAFATREAFGRCLEAVSSRLAREGAGRVESREIEDVCLADFVLKGQEDDLYYMISALNPSTSVGGFERETPIYREATSAMDGLKGKKKAVEKDGGNTAYKLRLPSRYWSFDDYYAPDFEGMRRILSSKAEGGGETTIFDMIFDVRFAKEFDREKVRVLLSYALSKHPDRDELLEHSIKFFDYVKKFGEFVLETRSFYAVQSAVSYPRMNTAVVIGAYHMDSMLYALLHLAYGDMPTVHFLERECTNMESFLTSDRRLLEIVSALGESH